MAGRQGRARGHARRSVVGPARRACRLGLRGLRKHRRAALPAPAARQARMALAAHCGAGRRPSPPPLGSRAIPAPARRAPHAA
eukprot:10913608-Lingulodinium_polyedra.AAC.1